MHFAIVGAGPAGAALGYLLARAGGRVTLLERQTDFAREFRGEVLMPSGLDAIAQMGLGAALDALPQSRVTHGALYQGARRLFELPFGTGGPRVVSQPALLESLFGSERMREDPAHKVLEPMTNIGVGTAFLERFWGKRRLSYLPRGSASTGASRKRRESRPPAMPGQPSALRAERHCPRHSSLPR